MKWGLVSRNVCDLVTPPRKARFEIQPFTVAQVQTFLTAIQGHKWEALFTLALATGMRQGELLGLKWQDINFAAGTLQARRILTRIPSATGKVYIEAEPKTQKSRRNITIAAFALEALKQHRLRQIEIKLKAGSLWEDHDYVFCTLTGTHLRPSHVVVEFKQLLSKADLPDIRFHDLPLRHSAATLLLSAGVHAKVVQEMLGHTQIGMTMGIYSHVLPSMQQDAVSKLNDLVIKKDDRDAGERKVSESK